MDSQNHLFLYGEIIFLGFIFLLFLVYSILTGRIWYYLGNVLSKFYNYYSLDPTTAIMEVERNSINDLKKHWKIIKKEIQQNISKMDSIEGDQFFEKDITCDGKWSKIYLKWYSSPAKYAHKLFPKTMEIIDRHPDIKLAMFSKLLPGAIIHGHNGLFKGCIRGHLGLITPNSPECFILIDNNKYWWKDGEVLTFDDTFWHSVQNNTEKPRLILFFDIERRVQGKIPKIIHKLMCNYICSFTSRANKNIKAGDVVV